MGLPRSHGGILAATAVTLLLLVVSTATAHTYLESSMPEPNGHLDAGASIIVLQFGEILDPTHIRVHIETDDGTPVELTTEQPERRPQEIRVRTEPLPDGVYTVAWEGLSVDGHDGVGTLHFSVGAATVDEPAPARSWEPTPEQGQEIALEGLVRGILLFSVISLLGLAYFELEIAPRTLSSHRIPWAVAVLGLLATVAGLALVALLAGRLGRPIEAAIGTVAGTLLIVKSGLALVAGIAGSLAIRRGVWRRRWLALAGAVALAVLLVHSLAGHGVAGEAGESDAGHWILYANLLHTLMAAIWVGGVVGFLLIAPEATPTQAGRLVERFSPWAIASVLVVGVTGAGLALEALPGPGALWSSSYGLFLTGKVLLGVILVGIGYRHRYELGPWLRKGVDRLAALRRTLRAEACIMFATVAVAGLLAASPLPDTGVVAADVVGGQSHEARVSDYHVEATISPDPLRPEQEQRFEVELWSESFRSLDEVTVELTIPAAVGEGTVALERWAGDRWGTEQPLFTEAGDWLVTVRILDARGAHEASFEVEVLPRA